LNQHAPFLLRLGRPGSTDHTTEPLSVSSRGAAFLFPAFPVSNATAYADLTGLVEKGLIERAGIGRGAFYFRRWTKRV
jgi:hypothetical protein